MRTPQFPRVLVLLTLTWACSAPPETTADLDDELPTTSTAPKALAGSPPQRLHDDVAWLADDAQEGRRAGTLAGKRSGEWIATRMKQLGLEPAGDIGSYLQEFQVPLPVEVGPNSSVAQFKTSTDVVPLFCSSGGEASGPLEWRGYGIVNAEKKWNDYSERCDGKVVVVLRGTPPDTLAAEAAAPPADNVHGGNVQASEGWGNSGSLFLKVMNAKKNGAVAVVIVPHPSHSDEPLPPFDHSRAALSGIPAFAISADAAKQLLGDYSRDVREIDSGEMKDPLYTRIELQNAAPIRVLADLKREKGPAYNVLGRLKGADSTRCVVVGAHYDHLGFGGEGSLAPGEQGQIHNGADDNASGTATVLEMARSLAHEAKPPCDILFALWSGEELGLLGSEWWAQHPTVPLARVTANLNLDMVGRAGNGTLSVLGAGTAEPFEGWLKDLGARHGLELKVSGSGQGIGGSDHQTFLKRKIPAVHFFSGVHTDYHKPSDDTDKFESEGAAKVASLGEDLVQRMCAAGKLAWTEPPAPAEGAAKVGSVFRVWFGSVPDYAFEGKGLLLTGTSAGSPAEKAGMLAGDIVTKVGDIEIETIQDFMYALQTYKPGDVVLTKFLRDGKPEEVRVTLSTRDAQ